MLRDKATLGYIGLSEREITVIQSIFRMTERFHTAFELPRENERRVPDVLFIDRDSEAALSFWDDFRTKVNPSAVPIFVSGEPKGQAGEYHISRPLVLRKLMEVLDAVQGRYSSNELTGKQTTAASTTAGLRILVVDDSLPVRTYMHQKINELCAGRVSVDFAEDGNAATSQVEKRDYDLIFLDVMMPGLDGYKTCKWIKANKPTYVSLLTSRSSPFDKVRGTMSGCDTYLVKPPQDEDLKRIIAGRVRALESEGLLPSGLFEAISL